MLGVKQGHKFCEGSLLTNFFFHLLYTIHTIQIVKEDLIVSYVDNEQRKDNQLVLLADVTKLVDSA